VRRAGASKFAGNPAAETQIGLNGRRLTIFWSAEVATAMSVSTIDASSANS
jgi:hypothetical protein